MEITRRQFHALTAVAPLSAAAASEPPRPKRKDCFLGMHFDLHPSPRDKALGCDVTEEMVEKFLDRVNPDYVQYDYKGHVGYIGYPSEVSTSAPVIKNSLEIWRRVTARRGVSLYIHFSGVIDHRAVAERPEWAVIGADGKPDEQTTSTFSSYVDDRMIPQLEEAIEKYGIDGAWVDGECWGTRPDYGEAAAAAFKAETGIHPPPKSPAEKGWSEWLEFSREAFRKYLKHYIDALHAFRPGFEVASNWMYTTFVPERPELPVDFVSGDFLGNACISQARLESRYLAQIGKPWDLMAWGFQSARRNPVGQIHKPAVQLQQEAAVLLAQGGGFQIYYQPTRAGYLDDRLVGVMARVAGFCRERQELCHQSETVPEIGVLLSRRSLYVNGPRLFGGWGDHLDPARGTVDALVENHFCVDVVPDWRLDEIAGRYRMMVVPDWDDIGGDARDTLVNYARRGGKLLVIGAANAALFEDVLGARLAGQPRNQPAYIPGREVFANLRGLWQDVEASSARVMETRFPAFDATRSGTPAATLASLGKGEVAAFYGPFGSVFAKTHAPEARHAIGRIVRAMISPSVSLDGPPAIEIARRRKGGREVLHLINASGMQIASDYGVIDYVPPAGPIRVSIRTGRRPEQVTLEPGGARLKGNWSKGVWTTTLDRLDIHTMITWT